MNEKKPKAKKTKKGPKFVWFNLDNTHYLSVRQCVEELGFRVTDSEWKNQVFWYDAGGSIEVAASLEPWQFYNHFPGIWSISRKVELARNFERMNRLLPDSYSFHPKSFLLPGQFSDMKTYMQSIPKKNKRTFIIKPDRGSQGRGIILVQDPDTIDTYSEMSVAQQYISPYLIDGYKFDLRIYVLITSVNPLRIYIHEEGMARFCTEAYVKPKSSNLDQAYSHLTNYSLNKKNENFQQPESAEEADIGSKRSLSSVYKDIKEKGGNVEELKAKIDDIIRLTLGAVQPFLQNNYQTAISMNDGKSRCFEILGFDVLIDKHLNPWLLEVNCMPSLSCDSPFDQALKSSVIKGTLKIIGFNPNFKKLVLARQRAVTQKRISGVTSLPIKPLFDPEVESEVASKTQWRQIYPIAEDHPCFTKMNEALSRAKECPVGAAIETTASRVRKEAVLAQIREKENIPQPKKQRIVKSVIPRSDQTSSKKKMYKPLPRVANLNQKAPPLPVNKFEEAKIYIDFKDLNSNYISEIEERDRLCALRSQIILSQSVGMLQKIKALLNDKDKPKSPIQCQPQIKPNKVLKPVFVYKQYNGIS